MHQFEKYYFDMKYLKVTLSFTYTQNTIILKIVWDTKWNIV